MKIYLASPYSHDNVLIRKIRFDSVCAKAAELMMDGHIVFSPIAHSHPISRWLDNPNDGDFYLKQDLAMLPFFDEMWVLTLDGWRESKGIAREIEYANKLGIKVKYIA